MKSGKQRRAELDAKKNARAAKDAAAVRERHIAGGTIVNKSALAPDGNYSVPDFVERGFYVDKPFECIDCGKAEVWKAAQQKWWYEIAKGSVWTTARRCRPCRRKERERKEATRRAQVEGTARNLNRRRTGHSD
jgi:hypothetical protein